MPPQPGTFAISQPATQPTIVPYPANQYNEAGSTRPPKRKRSPKLSSVPGLSNDDLSHKAADMTMKLMAVTSQLCVDPTDDPTYQMRLYPITIERAAKLEMLGVDYQQTLLRAEQAYTDETSRVEEEWTSGKARVRERLLEGIEERRRRAREEKDADILGDPVIDAQARPHMTRKVKEKMVAAGNSSPKPSTPLLQPNANSLRIEDITTPFPLPLTSIPLPPSTAPVPPVGGRRKGKGTTQAQSLWAKGVPSYFHLSEAKESEKDADLNEIRRSSKRKRGLGRG